MDRIKSFISKLGKGHGLMLIGCVAMMGALFFLPFNGLNIGSAGYILLILLCPLMHVLMMMGMHGKKHEQHNHEETSIVREIESKDDQ